MAKSRPPKPETPAEQPAGHWKRRIVGHAEVDPREIVAHPLNTSLHTQSQRDALDAAIAEIGFIRSVTVNKTTGRLIDGHKRIIKALHDNEPLVDVEYVELSEDEERLALATLDRIANMGKLDPEKVRDLHGQLKTRSPALMDLLNRARADSGIKDQSEGVVEMQVKAPPKMTWVLLGIPTVRFGEIAETVDGLAQLDGVLCEMTVNDGPK